MRRSPATPERAAARFALAAALGALHAASFVPPLSAWWLQLAALAALVGLISHAPASRQALLAWTFGLGWFGGGLAWLHTSMHVYGGMPWLLAALAVALFAAYLALFPALAAAAAAALFAGSGPRARTFAFAGLWGLVEMARGHLFTGFPWLATGYAHVDGPLAGFAPWLGVYGIGALAALAAALMAETAIAARTPHSPLSRRASRAALAAALAGAILLGGAALARIEPTSPTGPPVTVRLVQGNVPQQLKFDPQRALSAMREYAAAIESSRAALVVLPETAWTMPWAATPPAIATAIVEAAGRSGGALAIGMPLPEPAAATARLRTRYTNSVALIDGRSAGAAATPAGDAIVARYDKRHLVPFGEFIPAGFGWFVALMDIPLGEFARGARGQPPFEVAGQRFAFNVCYEDLFGEEIVEAVRAAGGATVLVNVSNIAWFGDSQALPQHLAISRMRTLETGRPMLRATNTGVTAAIDHRGRVTGRLPHYVAGALDVTVQGTGGLTAYVRHGNLLPLAACAALLALAWLAARKTRSRRAKTLE